MPIYLVESISPVATGGLGWHAERRAYAAADELTAEGLRSASPERCTSPTTRSASSPSTQRPPASPNSLPNRRPRPAARRRGRRLGPRSPKPSTTATGGPTMTTSINRRHQVRRTRTLRRVSVGALAAVATSAGLALALSTTAAAHNRAHIILPDGRCIVVGSEKWVDLPDGTRHDLRPETPWQEADEFGTSYAAPKRATPTCRRDPAPPDGRPTHRGDFAIGLLRADRPTFPHHEQRERPSTSPGSSTTTTALRFSTSRAPTRRVAGRLKPHTEPTKETTPCQGRTPGG